MIVAGRVEGIERDLEIEHNRAAWTAWHVASLMRWDPRKKLPKMETMLHRKRDRAPQTPDQMLGIVKMLNAAYGGSVITRKA